VEYIPHIIEFPSRFVVWWVEYLAILSKDGIRVTGALVGVKCPCLAVIKIPRGKCGVRGIH